MTPGPTPCASGQPQRVAPTGRWRRLTAVFVAVAGGFLGGHVSTPAQSPGADGVALLLLRLERVLETSDARRLDTLLSPNVAPLVLQLAPKLFAPGTTRAVVKEREREPLGGALPGDGYRLVVEVFSESRSLGRIVTARVDVRRAPGDESADAWRVVSLQPLTVVEGLNRLEVDETHQFAARGLVLTSEDLKITLADGSVFVVNSAAGVTGLVLLGRGQLEFSPAPQMEREQLRLFADTETLVAPFETAFVRINPGDFVARKMDASLVPATADPRLLRRAREVFAQEAPKSFSVDLGDLSREMWYLVPPSGDFLAEVRTRGHGAVTYARSNADAEDVSFFERAKGRDIARYASVAKLQTRGRFYNEDDLADYDVVDYDIDANLSPQREFVDGRARMRIRIRAPMLAVLSVRLAEPLVVTSATSPELGRLLHLRVRTRDTIVVNLPVALRRGTEITVAINYSGRLPSQTLEQESLQLGPPPADFQQMSAERYYLLSSKAFWYPQPSTSDYATATLRITVPDAYGCTASGLPLPGFRTAVSSTGEPTKIYVFRAVDPVRYLAVVVSRLRSVASGAVPLTEELAPDSPRLLPDGTRLPGFQVNDRVALETQASPRMQSRGRELHAWAGDILRYYASIMGGAPYPALTVAAVEHQVPGGHGPPYFVVVNNTLPGTQVGWRNDPAYFLGYPEFFIAHEIAHQWWGQAVGWENYHEQWLSEGFAQYFAALYAKERHGDETFLQMLRQFRRWSLEMSDQGPIYLGYRLGQMQGDRRVFRALLYNKGAGVLHMLRRLIGDEAFFAGLRRIYNEKMFEKAGTDDVQRAFEAESGRPLGRFFDRWVFESRTPRVHFAATIAPREVVVRFKQLGDTVFDLPVTVTLGYSDGRSVDVLVPVTEQSVELKIPADGTVRSVKVNRDNAAIAEFDES